MFPEDIRDTDRARFWAKVDRQGTDECWLWQGTCMSNGYGVFGFRGKSVLAHRFSYTATVGVIPAGLEIDHVHARGCRHHHCVNPAHLEPVTRAENMRRRNELKTHCPHGHPYSGDNLYINPNTGRRYCCECINEHKRQKFGFARREIRNWPESVGDAYLAGASCAELAAALGSSEETVRNHLHEAGVPIRRRGPRPQGLDPALALDQLTRDLQAL